MDLTHETFERLAPYVILAFGFYGGWLAFELRRLLKVRRFQRAIKAMTKKDWQITADVWLELCPIVFYKGSDFVGRIDATYVAGLNEGLRMERRRAAGEEENVALRKAVEAIKH